MWDLFFINPMVNLLVWLYALLGNNYFLAIILITLLIKGATWPLMASQLKSTAAMQELQPKMKKIQEKYKDNPEMLNQETMKLYKEAGVNPLGGCLPTLVQFPILIGLYQAVTQTLAGSPLQLIGLAGHLYTELPAWLSWLPSPTTLVPLNSRFLWLDLAAPDQWMVLPALVIVSTFIYQKLITPPNTSTDPSQAAMTRSMQLMMPLMIGAFSINFPAGLSVYWVTSNLLGLAQAAAQGRVSAKNLFGTEDGSFSWSGLLGLDNPSAQEPEPRGRSGKRSTRK